MSRLASIILLLLLPATAFAHGTSKSYADWVVEGSSAEMRVNFAPHDFTLVVTGLDANGDQKLEGSELAPKKKEIAELALSWTKVASARAKGESLVPCDPAEPRLSPVGDPVEELQVAVRFDCSGPIGFIQLETKYFPTFEPAHVSVATFTQGEITAQHVFTKESPVFGLELEPPSIGKVLGEHAQRGILGTTTVAVVFSLGLLCLLVESKRAPLYLAAFVLAMAIAVVLMRTSELGIYLGAFAVALAGVEALVAGRQEKSSVVLRRIAPALLAGFGAGMSAHLASSSSLPMKLAFLAGATIAPIAFTVLALVLARFIRGRTAERAAGAAALAASAALFFLAVRP